MIDGQGPPHTHSREDETIYVLDGTVEATCGFVKREAALASGAGGAEVAALARSFGF